jgi:transmembrane sensor
VVSAGAVFVQAVGTAFNVRLAAAEIEVLVTEGTVRLDKTGSATPTQPPSPSTSGSPVSRGPTFLQANERALISTARLANATPTVIEPRIERVELPAIRQALAWQERKLVFVETPLRDVVAQFNRRNATQLILADVALEERPVGGTFAADNVEAFVWLLESAGYVTVERRGTREIVLRKAQ